MKKLIIFTILLLQPLMGVYAQSEDTEHEPVYFYVNSKSNNDLSEGVWRGNGSNNDPCHRSVPIYFSYISKSKKVRASFMHIDYNTYELSKIRPVRWDDTMEIRTEPASFLDNNYIIDLDELFESMSKEEIWEYFENLRGKKVYFIDKNPQFNHITSQTVKLIQVKPTISNKPQNNILFE